MQYAQRPRWAPDGTITLQGVDLKGRQGIYRFNPDSGQLEALVLRESPKDSAVVLAAWLPGGEQLMFQRNHANTGNQRSLVLRNVRTGEERVLVDQEHLEGGHTISADGRHVAFVTERAGTSTLAVLDIAGGSRREIITASLPGQLGGLSLWTPDDRSLLFSRMENGKPSLWIVSASGGSARSVKIEPGRGLGSLRVHPDGRRVAYNTGTLASELWRLDNFLPRRTGTSTKR
jgi:Tol biopolymer transport system component